MTGRLLEGLLTEGLLVEGRMLPLCDILVRKHEAGLSCKQLVKQQEVQSAAPGRGSCRRRTC